MGRKAGLILMALVLLGMAGFVSAHSITVDGSPTDWEAVTGTQSPNTEKLYSNVSEWVWKDATGDVVNRLASGESITIDGSLDDWRANLVVGTADDNSEDGANLDKLYVAWDDSYLYIAITTRNSESWNVAYGFGIDVDPGSGNGYTGGSNPSDAWNRKIGFKSPFAIDYEIYFYWDSSSNSITSAQLAKYTGSGWTYTDLTSSTDYAYTGGSDGLQTLEIKIPWSSLGSNGPEDVAVISWITGSSGSAVSSAPWDSTLDDNNDEWSDVDYFSNLMNFGRVDVTEFRVTADDQYFYFLIRFKDLDVVGQDGAPGIMITIDTDQKQNSGQTYFGYNSETQVAKDGNANWEYQLLIDLANSQVKDGGTVYGDGKTVWNDGSPLDLVDTNWNDVSSSSDEFVASTSNNAVEVRILKSELGNPSTIRVELGVVRVNPSGDAWDSNGGDSDVVDAMTTAEPSTWDEVQDGYIDYYADIDISQVPFFSDLAVALAVVLGAVLIFRRR